MTSPTPIITPPPPPPPPPTSPTNPPTVPPKSDIGIESFGAPITVQPVIVKWWKKWSTHLAGINLVAVIAAYQTIPDRILDAIPSPVYAFIGVSLLAVILIPAATSIKQVKKVE